MAHRIKRTPTELRDQLNMAAAAATAAGPGWPSTAPTPLQLTTAANNLNTSITTLAALKADVSQESDIKDGRMDVGIGFMERVDEATDFTLGPEHPGKLDYGLTPRNQGTVPPLHKLQDIALLDGPNPGSLKADWEPIEGASYEIVWATNSTFTTIVGSATSASASDYIISGLVPATQYWVRIRPHRSGETAEWSDPETRIAPL